MGIDERTRKSASSHPSWRGRLIHLVLGAALGVLILHPVTMAIYWLELHESSGPHDLASMANRLAQAFRAPMTPMALVFAALGGFVGLGFAAYHSMVARVATLRGFLEREFERDIPSLLAGGETERVEFKASVRWDFRQNCVNKSLALPVVRSLAGLMNHRGGSLLIGITDDAAIVGIENDFQGLKRPDRDGFEQFLMSQVRSLLGGEVCTLVHPIFARIEDKEICQLIVEPSEQPVYYDLKGVSRFVVRAGNSTRELDAKETIAYVSRRWPSRAT